MIITPGIHELYLTEGDIVKIIPFSDIISISALNQTYVIVMYEQYQKKIDYRNITYPRSVNINQLINIVNNWVNL